jgi:hypothetical protein
MENAFVVGTSPSPPPKRKIFEGGKYSLFEVDLVIIIRKLITIWGTFGLSKNKITM